MRLPFIINMGARTELVEEIPKSPKTTHTEIREMEYLNDVHDRQRSTFPNAISKRLQDGCWPSDSLQLTGITRERNLHY